MAFRILVLLAGLSVNIATMPVIATGDAAALVAPAQQPAWAPASERPAPPKGARVPGEPKAPVGFGFG